MTAVDVMQEEGVEVEHPVTQETETFFEVANAELIALFDWCRQNCELDFVRTIGSDLWNKKNADQLPVAEAQAFFNENLMFLSEGDFTRLKCRIALGFYCQIADGVSYVEVLRNLLNLYEGGRFQAWPFAPTEPVTGRVLLDLAEQSERVGLADLAWLFRNAYNDDLIRSYRRADFIITGEGIRLAHRDGGTDTFMPLVEFHAWFERGMNFFEMQRQLVARYQTKYQHPTTIRGRLDDGPEQEWTVQCDLRQRVLLITA